MTQWATEHNVSFSSGPCEQTVESLTAPNIPWPDPHLHRHLLVKEETRTTIYPSITITSFFKRGWRSGLRFEEFHLISGESFTLLKCSNSIPGSLFLFCSFKHFNSKALIFTFLCCSSFYCLIFSFCATVKRFVTLLRKCFTVNKTWRYDDNDNDYYY